MTLSIDSIPALDDSDTVKKQAEAFSRTNTSVNSEAEAVERTWTKLGDQFIAPSDDVVHGAMTKPAARFEDMTRRVKSVAEAVHAYGDALVDLKRRREAIAARIIEVNKALHDASHDREAYTMSPGALGSPPQLTPSPDLERATAAEDALFRDMCQLREDIADAQREAANAIGHQFGAPSLRRSDETAVWDPNQWGSSADALYAGAGAEGQGRTPEGWRTAGTSAATQRNVAALYDAGAALLGPFWDSVFASGGRQEHARSQVISIERTMKSLTAWVTPSAWADPYVLRFAVRDTVGVITGLPSALVAADRWKDDPFYAGTTTAINVISLLGMPELGASKAAGTGAARAALTATRVEGAAPAVAGEALSGARAADEFVDAGRFGTSAGAPLRSRVGDIVDSVRSTASDALDRARASVDELADRVGPRPAYAAGLGGHGHFGPRGGAGHTSPWADGVTAMASKEPKVPLDPRPITPAETRAQYSRYVAPEKLTPRDTSLGSDGGWRGKYVDVNFGVPRDASGQHILDERSAWAINQAKVTGTLDHLERTGYLREYRVSVEGRPDVVFDGFRMEGGIPVGIEVKTGRVQLNDATFMTEKFCEELASRPQIRSLLEQIDRQMRALQGDGKAILLEHHVTNRHAYRGYVNALQPHINKIARKYPDVEFRIYLTEVK